MGVMTGQERRPRRAQQLRGPNSADRANCLWCAYRGSGLGVRPGRRNVGRTSGLSACRVRLGS